MATMMCSGLGRRKRSAFARGSRLSPGWGITPRRPVTPVAARSIHPPPRSRVPERKSPRPAWCAGGAAWTRSCEAPDWLRASGAAPGTSRAAMFTTESIASFFPQAPLRHPPRPAANGVRMRLALCAMGTRGPRTPRLRRGRIAGEVKELGHGTVTSPFVSFAPTCARRFRKTKNAPPMSLPSCAMRCIVGSLPAATASSEPG